MRISVFVVVAVVAVVAVVVVAVVAVVAGYVFSFSHCCRQR